MGRRHRPIAERLLEKIEKVASGCWEWTGSRGPDGYGRLSSRFRQPPHLAHRLSYTLHHGEIPPGSVVMHSCDNRSCINPAHLSVGTQADNLADMVSKGRSCCGIKRPGSKLSEAQVRRIRSSDLPSAALAAEFFVHARTIRDVRNGITWKHIT